MEKVFVTTLMVFLTLGIATGSLQAQSMKADTVYGNEAGCLAEKTPPNSDNHKTLTLTYVRAHETYCEFVQVLVGKNGTLFANAICTSEGFTAPDTFTISPVWGRDDTFAVSASGNDLIASPTGEFSECTK